MPCDAKNGYLLHYLGSAAPAALCVNTLTDNSGFHYIVALRHAHVRLRLTRSGRTGRNNNYDMYITPCVQSQCPKFHRHRQSWSFVSPLL